MKATTEWVNFKEIKKEIGAVNITDSSPAKADKILPNPSKLATSLLLRTHKFKKMASNLITWLTF
jgi:hypothetical protein